MADVEEKQRSWLFDVVLLAIGGLVALWLAFSVLGWIAGLVWFAAKVVLFLAVVGGLLYVVVRRRR